MKLAITELNYYQEYYASHLENDALLFTYCNKKYIYFYFRKFKAIHKQAPQPYIMCCYGLKHFLVYTAD